MIIMAGYNATGWTQLFDGNLIGAAFTAFDGPMGGWVIAILFVVYQFMLILKTKNMTLAWTTGILFASLFAVSQIAKSISLQVIFIILVLELAGILYVLLWK